MFQVDERVEEISEMFGEEKHGNIPDLDQVPKRGEAIVGINLTEKTHQVGVRVKKSDGDSE
jgi:hypothetical protein